MNLKIQDACEDFEEGDDGQRIQMEIGVGVYDVNGEVDEEQIDRFIPQSTEQIIKIRRNSDEEDNQSSSSSESSSDSSSDSRSDDENCDAKDIWRQLEGSRKRQKKDEEVKKKPLIEDITPDKK